MDTSKENGRHDSSLFGLPTSSNGDLARSREALLLRLEQMKMNNDAEKIETDSDSDSPCMSPSGKLKHSKAIPIVKSGRSRNFSSNEGRGFTDDMMFFAATCEDNDDKDSEVNNGSEPFVPPHLQQNDSFTVRSFV